MRRVKLLLISACTFLMCACSSGGHFNSRNNPIASILNAQSSEVTTEISEQESSIPLTSNNSDYPIYDNIDVDLTTMNATMVYSEVYNMINEPNSYVNKIIKVEGPFVPLESTDPDYCYPAILIMDATACCGNGLEFLLYGIPRCTIKGGNGYPLYNEEATIVGRFETYLENGYIYVHLVDAVWLKDAA